MKRTVFDGAFSAGGNAPEETMDQMTPDERVVLRLRSAHSNYRWSSYADAVL